MENNYSIYMHIFPNNYVYIGLTRQKPEKRWGKEGNGYKKQLVYKYIKYFGWNNIEHKILYSNISCEKAKEIEKELIKKYDKNYNVDKGGGIGGDCFETFLYEGKLYNSKQLAELSKYDITPHDVTNRINSHNWSIEKTLNTKLGNKNTKYEYKGKLYTTKELYEIRINKNITYEQIKSRLSKGWSVERAITQSNKTHNVVNDRWGYKWEYKGKLYTTKELAEISPVEDITSDDIVRRINTHGWSVERAVEQPKRKSKKYEYNGKMYTTSELVEISTVEGLKPNDINDRVKLGWSIEKAITQPKNIYI